MRNSEAKRRGSCAQALHRRLLKKQQFILILRLVDLFSLTIESEY